MDKKRENAGAAEEDVAPMPDAPPTAEQIEQWKAQAAKADEHWQRLLKEAADFDNYKKRAARERQDSATYANEALLQSSSRCWIVLKWLWRRRKRLPTLRSRRASR